MLERFNAWARSLKVGWANVQASPASSAHGSPATPSSAEQIQLQHSQTRSGTTHGMSDNAADPARESPKQRKSQSKPTALTAEAENGLTVKQKALVDSAAESYTPSRMEPGRSTGAASSSQKKRRLAPFADDHEDYDPPSKKSKYTETESSIPAYAHTTRAPSRMFTNAQQRKEDDSLQTRPKPRLTLSAWGVESIPLGELSIWSPRLSGRLNVPQTTFKYYQHPNKPNPPTFMGLPVELRLLIFEELARMIPDEHQKPNGARDYIRAPITRRRSPRHLQNLTGYEGWLVNSIRAPYRLNRACHAEACAVRLTQRWAQTMANQHSIADWRVSSLVYLLRTHGLPNR